MGNFWNWLFGRDDSIATRSPAAQAKTDKATAAAHRRAFDTAAAESGEDLIDLVARDDEATAQALYELLEQPTPWESLSARQKTWWRNRGRHTRRHSYCWEANVNVLWAYAGEIHLHAATTDPRGSVYHLALNRRRAAELADLGHGPITKTAIIFDTSDTPTGPEHPPRVVVDIDGNYVSATVNIAEPIGGMPAEVVTDRCHDDCLACGAESQEEAEHYVRSVTPISELDHERLKRRLRRIEDHLRLSFEGDDLEDAAPDLYGIRITGDGDDLP